MSPQEQAAALERFNHLLAEFFAAPRTSGRHEALPLHREEPDSKTNEEQYRC